MTSERVLEDYEQRKKRKYNDRVGANGYNFSPLVCSVYGTLAPEAARIANKGARGVDPDRGERDSVIDLHAVMLQAAVIKAVSLCLRARSWAVPPPVVELAVPEDAVVCLADAGFRDRDGY